MSVLLFDTNNLAIRCLFSGPVLDHSSKQVDYQLWRYICFESILAAIRKFRAGTDVVLGIDDSSWRRIIYPPYKMDRKKKRETEEQVVDWSEFFAEYSKFVELLRINLPFKVIKVESAEADDIVGVLALKLPGKKVAISTDSDYLQLYKEGECDVYDPIKKKLLTCDDTEALLLRYFIKGQSKDNIFNCLTPTDWPDDKRKPGIREKTIEKLIADPKALEAWLKENDAIERFNINRRIIDFRCIPNTIVERVMTSYNSFVLPEPGNFYSFFKEMGWRSVMEDYTNVENNLLRLYV